MYRRYKPIRAFKVVEPVEIYRVAGRRPSCVWVDESGQIVPPRPGAQPLKELVYWRTRAAPGEQIQEHLGGLFLVTARGDSHPIALCPPTPLAPETAFTHAQIVRAADAARIEELLVAGQLAEVAGARPKGFAARPADRLVADSHALVVEEPPAWLNAPADPANHGTG